MNVDVQLRSTAQPTATWPIWQWWITTIGVAAIASTVIISRRTDLPSGVWFVILASLCVNTGWDTYLRRHGRDDLRVILSRAWFCICIAPVFTLIATGVLSDWYVPVTTILFYTLLVGSALGSIVTLSTRRYVARAWHMWFATNIATGMLTVTAALFVHRAIATTAGTLTANFAASGIATLGWGSAPGFLLSRLVQTVPYDIWQDIQLQVQKLRARSGKWEETWALRVYFAVIVLSIVIPGLRTCGWLDTIVGRSGCVAQVELPRGYPDAVVWSPSAALVASTSLGGVQLLRIDNGQIVLDIPQSQVNAAPVEASIAPNGKLIALALLRGEESFVQVWNTSRDRVLEAPIGDYRSLAFSPDSQLMASGPNVWNLQTNDIEHTFAPKTQVYGFSADGTLLATSTWVDETGKVQIWDTASWTIATTITDFTDSIYDIDFSPDNRFVAVTQYRDQVEVRRVADGSTVWLKPQQLDVLHIAWSPDGSTLAAAGGNYEQGLVWLIRSEDSEIQRNWTTADDRNDIVVWSPDGTKLVTNGRYGWLSTWRIK